MQTVHTHIYIHIPTTRIFTLTRIFTYTKNRPATENSHEMWEMAPSKAAACVVPQWCQTSYPSNPPNGPRRSPQLRYWLSPNFVLPCLFLGSKYLSQEWMFRTWFCFHSNSENNQLLDLLVRRCLKSRSMLLREFSLYCQRIGVVATLPVTNLENSKYGTRISMLNCSTYQNKNICHCDMKPRMTASTKITYAANNYIYSQSSQVIWMPHPIKYHWENPQMRATKWHEMTWHDMRET